MTFSHSFLAILLCIAIGVQSEGVPGCGGSIKVSPEIMKYRSHLYFHRRVLGAAPNFAGVTVSLVNSYGFVQEQTECSPQGYFFIPMYDIVAHSFLVFLCRASIRSLLPRRRAGTSRLSPSL